MILECDLYSPALSLRARLPYIFKNIKHENEREKTERGKRKGNLGATRTHRVSFAWLRALGKGECLLCVLCSKVSLNTNKTFHSFLLQSPPPRPERTVFCHFTNILPKNTVFLNNKNAQFSASGNGRTARVGRHGLVGAAG